MKKTVEEINDRIKKGEAVVVTAEEVVQMAKHMKPSEISQRVDVVTTATFGPMCSSGAFINFGHSSPPIRMQRITLNNVPAYAGLAAVDAYIGATEASVDRENYGGAHVIEELIAGNDVVLKANSKGTDCYPRKEINTTINKDNVNELFMFNPRNAYQNYGVAVNTSEKIKFTYMGTLLPRLGNATYSTSGELSPLLKDPSLRSIGIGTRIFLGGTQGFIAWNGTQFNTGKPKNSLGIPQSNAATISVVGDMKQMSTEFIRAAYFERYGVSLFVGIGVPIPMLDEDMAVSLSVGNDKIETTVFDYGLADKPALGKVTYQQLQSGHIQVQGKKIRCAPLSSLVVARKISETLKLWVKKGDFLLTQPVQLFPHVNGLKSLELREVKNGN